MIDKRPHDGLVVLVGAGPGRAGLISRTGARWLARADCVVYDRLVNQDLLKACPDQAELIHVGKGPRGQAASQERINRLLIEHCRAGRTVVRLKGGDPYTFGRGGEEALALAEAGCAFRVVPGVTAATAAAAYAGIPLTDRRWASSVTFVTGHEDPAKGKSCLDYSALAKLDTLVFYMGVGNVPDITRRLIKAGRGGRTPAAVVANASLPNQRTIVATLDTIAEAIDKADIQPPALIIVGKAATMASRLNWFERLPLFGRAILVTRARRQGCELAEPLRELGAEVIEAPTICIEPADSFGEMDAALRCLGKYDWLALTSVNAVGALFDRLDELGLDARALAGVKLACIGPATADALRRRGLRADLVPETFTSEALAEALVSAGVGAGTEALLARADIATPQLPDALTNAGAAVTQLSVYRTALPEHLPPDALTALREGQADWITFTSASTVENFLTLTAAAGVGTGNAKLAAIGPVTAEALAGHDLAASVVAETQTIEGLIDAVVAAEAARKPKGPTA